MGLVVNLQMEKIFKHLGGTPVPPGGDTSKALAPHTMEMDPPDGKMEDDLYGLVGCVHGETEERIKKNGKPARLCYHPDKAENAWDKEGVGITQDVQDR
eukprot:1952826-Karenia_brevis.AAC.1